MKHILIGIGAAIILTACGGGGGTVPDEPETANVPITNPNDLIAIQVMIPYSENSTIQKKIKLECTELQTDLSNFIRDYSAAKGIGIVQKAKVSQSDKGKVLVVSITNAESSGNAFIGHRKSVTVSGSLYENGKSLGTFRGMRVSGGGFFAGFKGSCSVLGRTVKALGSDISLWLKNPVEGAMLGDL